MKKLFNKTLMFHTAVIGALLTLISLYGGTVSVVPTFESSEAVQNAATNKMLLVTIILYVCIILYGYHIFSSGYNLFVVNNTKMYYIVSFITSILLVLFALGSLCFFALVKDFLNGNSMVLFNLDYASAKFYGICSTGFIYGSILYAVFNLIMKFRKKPPFEQ